jgi:hypothetical protein
MQSHIDDLAYAVSGKKSDIPFHYFNYFSYDSVLRNGLVATQPRIAFCDELITPLYFPDTNESMRNEMRFVCQGMEHNYIAAPEITDMTTGHRYLVTSGYQREHARPRGGQGQFISPFQGLPPCRKKQPLFDRCIHRYKPTLMTLPLTKASR